MFKWGKSRDELPAWSQEPQALSQLWDRDQESSICGASKEAALLSRAMGGKPPIGNQNPMPTLNSYYPYDVETLTWEIHTKIENHGNQGGPAQVNANLPHRGP